MFKSKKKIIKELKEEIERQDKINTTLLMQNSKYKSQRNYYKRELDKIGGRKNGRKKSYKKRI